MGCIISNLLQYYIFIEFLMVSYKFAIKTYWSNFEITWLTYCLKFVIILEFYKFITNFQQKSYNLKGGLSPMDDLAVFKCFRVIFFLKNQTIQFLFSFNLYFQQKRAPKLSTYLLLLKSFVWVFDFTNRQNGFYSFQRYH